MSDPTQITPDAATPSTRARPVDRRRQRQLLGALAAVVAVLLLLLVATTGASDHSAEAAASPANSAGDESGAGSRAVDVGSGPTTTQPGDADEDGLDQTDDSSGYPESGANVEEPGVPGDGGDGPVELDPVDTVDEQCAKVLATGASLLVTPDPAVLEAGDMSSALTIRNCGDDAIDWTAKTVPHVHLDTSASSLAAATTTQLGYTIDSDAYEPGAIDFKIKVSEPGHNHYVDVHAFRKTVGKDLQAGGGMFTAGEGAGGCANECITKAWLTPAVSTANLGFEVKTNTPAKIRVWVGTQPPTGNGAPMAMSPNGSTQWNTVLKPLQPSTKYHLLLRATDGNGKTDERTTTFTTVTPADNQDELASVDPKCLAQCISKALLTPGGDFSQLHLDVDATTPARFQARVSTAAPTYTNGVPHFSDPDVVVLSGLEYLDHWSTDVSPLEGGTTYHIIVLAEDVDGHIARQVGQFTTAPEPAHDVLITFQRLTVTHDGDSSWNNRGELSFAWAVGDTNVGTRGESKMSDGDSFGFNRSKSSYLATGLHADDFLPNVRVSGSERDPDGKTEFCAMGSGTALEWGHSDACDAKWNVASSGFVSVASIESMARCSTFGLEAPTGDDGCMYLETVDHGSDYARFRVLVSFHVAS